MGLGGWGIKMLGKEGEGRCRWCRVPVVGQVRDGGWIFLPCDRRSSSDHAGCSSGKGDLASSYICVLATGYLKAESIRRYKVPFFRPVNLGIHTAAAPRRIEPSRQKRALG